MNKEYIKSAENCCTCVSLSAAKKFFGSQRDVNLGVIQLNPLPEVIWYTIHKDQLLVMSAFKDFYNQNNSLVSPDSSYVIDQIPKDDYFVRKGVLYYYDAEGTIYQIAICGNEELASLYAQTLQIQADECSLVKLFTI